MACIQAEIDAGAIIDAINDDAEFAAEIERLREALGLIRDYDRVYGVTPQSNGAQVWHDGECGAIAGAALAVQP